MGDFMHDLFNARHLQGILNIEYSTFAYKFPVSMSFPASISRFEKYYVLTSFLKFNFNKNAV